MAEETKYSKALLAVFNKINTSKERRDGASYPFLPSGDHYLRVKGVTLFKNKDGIVYFKFLGDVVKSSAPGLEGVHTVLLAYKDAMADANREETKQILSAISASQLDLLNDAERKEMEAILAEGGSPDSAMVESTQKYRFRPLVSTTTEEALDQGWLEVDFGDEARIPYQLNLSDFDLYVFSASYDKKLWEDGKKKSIPRINSKTGEQAQVVVHNWRGCSMVELRKEGILQ